MELRAAGAAESRISRRVLDAGFQGIRIRAQRRTEVRLVRFPAASATRCGEGVAAVGGGGDSSGSEGPAAPFDGGIAEEGCTGIDAEGVSGAEVAAKAAREGGSAVVGASAIVEVSLDEPDVVGDARDGAACGGSSGIKDQPSCVGGSTKVSSSISNARREGVGAVGGEVGCGSEGPAAPFDGGIAEEGFPGINAEGVSGAEVAAKGACEGGGEVVGAGAIVEVSVDEPDVVGDARDDAACGGSSGIKNQPVCVGGVPRFPAASATRAEKEWLRLVARSESGVKSRLRPSTEALPRKDAPE